MPQNSTITQEAPRLPPPLLESMGNLPEEQVRALMKDVKPDSYSLVLLSLEKTRPQVIAASHETTEKLAEATFDAAAQNTTKTPNAPMFAWKQINAGLWRYDLSASKRILYAFADNGPDTALQTATLTLDQALMRIHALEETVRTQQHMLEAERAQKEIEKQLRIEAEEKCRFDALTGLRNRWAFDEESTPYIRKVEREWHNNPGHDKIGVLMFDIDHFKRFNDRYGHAIGDLVLQHVATVTRQTLRDADMIYRLGGEEFGVLCSIDNKKGMLVLAEKLRRAMMDPKNTLLHPKTGEPLDITISVGATIYAPRHGLARQPSDILAVADAAMYTAKYGWKRRDGTQVGPRNNSYFMPFTQTGLEKALKLNAERENGTGSAPLSLQAPSHPQGGAAPKLTPPADCVCT